MEPQYYIFFAATQIVLYVNSFNELLKGFFFLPFLCLLLKGKQLAEKNRKFFQGINFNHHSNQITLNEFKVVHCGLTFYTQSLLNF